MTNTENFAIITGLVGLFAAEWNALNLSALLGKSLTLSDICRLKGEFCPSVLKPLQLPCLWSMLGVAWGRSIANGLTGGALFEETSTALSSLSVKPCWRKEPLRVKVEFFASNVIVTPHSLSLFCLRSKQTAKAQPTAWDNRSPDSRRARKPWHIHRRVVPSLQM